MQEREGRSIARPPALRPRGRQARAGTSSRARRKQANDKPSRVAVATYAFRLDGADTVGCVVTVVSPHLVAVDAAWDDGPDAGAWIASRLGPFGASVGHAVPLGYPAYAVVRIAPDDLHTEFECLPALEILLDVLSRFSGEQAVHCGTWEGWGWWYDTGADPRMAAGMGVGVAWPEGADRPAQEEIDRALATAREELAAERVECPDVEPLDLPYRRYYLWTGPLRSATGFRHQPHDPPSLIWPEDRSWFVGVPIYTTEIAVGGTTVVVDAVIADPRLNAHLATPDDVLDIDD